MRLRLGAEKAERKFVDGVERQEGEILRAFSFLFEDRKGTYQLKCAT